MNTNTNRNSSTYKKYNVRGKNGRFVTSNSSKRTSNPRTAPKATKPEATINGNQLRVNSSLIKSVRFNEGTLRGYKNTVSITLKSSPQREYIFQNKVKSILMNAVKSGKSLGSVYNKDIKGANLQVATVIYTK